MKILVLKGIGIGTHGVIARFHVEEGYEREHRIRVFQKRLYATKFLFKYRLAMKTCVRLEPGFGANGAIVAFRVAVE